ncbi:MAG: DUF4174 domain-containing protein [Cyclobacteriaceae bacterium]|nr:DUF4174 domain-containing protein [Cyclobacteriaceae bacterium]
MPLQEYQWKNRVLLIFSESPEDQNYKQQIRLLNENADGLTERDLTVLSVFPDRVEKNNARQTSDFSALSLRQYYKISTSFTIVLIGKDGGEKRRTQTILKPEELFGIIDAMPMRRAEMEKGR